MALYPCDVEPHRYPGPQQTVYPAIVQGSDAVRRRLRLCPHHFRDAIARLEERAQSAQIDFFDARPLQCLVCQTEVSDSPWQFFATTYAKDEDRKDWWALLHSDCVAAAMDAWGLTA
jgi:hypothetical protein